MKISIGEATKVGAEGRPITGRFLLRDEKTGRAVLIESEGFMIPEWAKEWARNAVFGRRRAGQMARRLREQAHV